MNPKQRGDRNGNGSDIDSYDFLPESASEWAAYFHDKNYDKLKATGTLDAISNTDVLSADQQLAFQSSVVLISGKTSGWDKFQAYCVYATFSNISMFKSIKKPIDTLGKNINKKTGEAEMKNYTPPMPYSPDKFNPSF